MTETRTPRLIVLEMEPLFRNLCQGTDAAVSLSRSRDIEDPDHNGLVFVAEGIDSAARRVHRARGRSVTVTGWWVSLSCPVAGGRLCYTAHQVCEVIGSRTMQ